MRKLEAEHIAPKCERTFEIGNGDASVISGNDAEWLLAHNRNLTTDYADSQIQERRPRSDSDLKTLQTKRTLRPLSNCTKFRRRMSRFPAHRCIKEYKTILFRKKKTPAGGNHPGRPGNFHPNICANHYHL
jgi:hypothetical protein